jgi:hypothetical protein
MQEPRNFQESKRAGCVCDVGCGRKDHERLYIRDGFEEGIGSIACHEHRHAVESSLSPDCCGMLWISFEMKGHHVSGAWAPHAEAKATSYSAIIRHIARDWNQIIRSVRQCERRLLHFNRLFTQRWSHLGCFVNGDSCTHRQTSPHASGRVPSQQRRSVIRGSIKMSQQPVGFRLNSSIRDCRRKTSNAWKV